MGTLYKFIDKDGEVKWGEISIGYDANQQEYRDGEPIVPVVIEDGYPGAGEIRRIKISEILESR